MTPYSPSYLDKKKSLTLIRISNELKSELDDAKNAFLPFRVSYNDVMSMLPRCPKCGALLLKSREESTVQCWKCRKKYTLYTLTEVS